MTTAISISEFQNRPLLKNQPAISLTFFLALSAAACTAIPADAENQTHVRVIDLKFPAAPIAWVNDDTILLRVDTGERVSRKDEGRSAVHRVVTYNYRTGERRTYGRADTGLCYADGYISYFHQDDATGELIATYGGLGQETVQKVRPGEIDFDRVGGSCRPLKELRKPPDWAQGKYRTWNLRPEHGVINCNTLDIYGVERHKNAKFHLPGDSSGIELPFSCYSVRLRLKYYPFRGAYFSPEHAQIVPWPVGRDRKAYWLFPDGRTETIVLPYSSAVRENMVPTARGIVAFSRPATREEEYGAYLIAADGSKRILRGHAAGVTSPDGCKVAMLHDPEFEARVERRRVSAPITLKVLEVCTNK